MLNSSKTTVTLLGVAVFLCLGGYVTGRSVEANPTSTRSERAIQNNTEGLTRALELKGLQLGSPIFMRVYKSVNGSDRDGRLEAFVENEAGEFVLFKHWDICKYSGELGPKRKEGDYQSPEGFYFVRPSQMNPNSNYHLSFNLGFPNAYDRAHGRTGSFLMVHGSCVSIGCYAMTDAGIEEIYTLMQAAFEGGQPFIRVHAFPFPMTEVNMRRYEGHAEHKFWVNLKQGWDWFETRKTPPDVTVNHKHYQFAPR